MTKRRELTFKMNGDCMECTSHYCKSARYPSIFRNGKLWTIARYLYTEKHGKIPKGMHIRHTCDNNWCVNIDHLIIGTHQQNMQDMMIRGRNAKGSIIGLSKLTEEQVVEIRNLKGSMYNREIGDKYGVDQSTISRILAGKMWKHVL